MEEKPIKEQELDAEEIHNHSCEFYIEKEGKHYGCDKLAFGITRCKYLCLTHYNFIRRDNKKRNLKGETIPNNFSVIIHTSPVIPRLCKKEINKPEENNTLEELDLSDKPLSYIENEEEYQF